MENSAIEGDSPVIEIIKTLESFPSRAGHEKSCLNPGGPSSKAKYSYLTDSELVPRGKGEKNPDEGSEIDPETVHLQAVEALCFLRKTVRRRTFCIMSQRVTSL